MTIVWSIIVFSCIILGLSYILLFANKRLVPQGDVKIIVNGDVENPLLVEPGNTLLTALSDKSVFLPSACGGGGTRAMCECHVDSGGGDVLPTEMNHLTRKEAADKSCGVFPEISRSVVGTPKSLNKLTTPPACSS